MNICDECGNGYCPSRARRTFGQLPRGICSPTCKKNRAVTEDKTELLAEQICQALMKAGHIDDYDCDTVNLIKEIIE